ncbi:MAG: hypothetical protein ACRDIV_20715 [Ktedonobacteraceae bacterium]
MNGIEKTQGQVQHVGSFRIYVTPDGKLVMPMGNGRVTVNQAEAKAMLDNLFMLASQFASHVATASNGAHAGA